MDQNKEDAGNKLRGGGRFQSTYMREMREPGVQDYTSTSRHGERDKLSKENVSQSFKFPIGISTYDVDYNHKDAPKLADYGKSKEPKNDRSVACVPLSGYQTSYADQTFFLRHKEGLHRYKPKAEQDCSSQPPSQSTSQITSNTTRPFGPWNYTGTQEENTRILRDRPLRAQKGLYHLPGYMGHQTLHNTPSTTAFERRDSEKDKMLLYDLAQYSRKLWPHYKGFKPQALRNVKDSSTPTTKTTYGYTNYMMQKQQAWARQHRPSNSSFAYYPKMGATKTFFTEGASGATSANGVRLAENFYSYFRPLEGTLVSVRADKMLASTHLE